MSWQKAKNKKEFLELIKTYRGITLEKIEKDWYTTEGYQDGEIFLFGITGFGDQGTCTLCLPLTQLLEYECPTRCKDCVYKCLTGDKCFQGSNGETYLDISTARSPQELFKAINARADYMETLIPA